MTGGRELQADTVDALVETTWGLIEDEIGVGQALETRASALAGFAGVILTLAGAVGSVEGASRQPHGAKIVIVISFGLGLALLVATILVSVLLVLRPRPVEKLAMQEVARYPTHEFVYRDKVEIQGRTLRGLVTSLASLRDASDVMGRRLRWAYLVFAAGLICIAVESFVLGYHTLF